MLRARVITAVVLLALIAAAAAWSDAALRVLCAALVAMGMYEWIRLAGVGRSPAAVVAAAYGALLAALSSRDLHASQGATVGAALAASAAWCALGAVLVAAERGRLRVAGGVSVLLATTLLSAGWIALDSLLQRGVQWLVSVLAVVWIADIAAYFSGRALGRHKLAPHISPGKTWEGVWGALLIVTSAALAVHAAWPHARLWSNQVLSELAWPLAFGCLWAVVALSIVGDLFESLLKRQAQVKDSGWILPGHGGVLDRIDATLPTLPAAVLIDWWTR